MNRGPRALGALILLASSLLSCSGDPAIAGDAAVTDSGPTNPGRRVSLVDQTRWAVTEGSADPFPGHRPPAITCAPGAAKLEGELYELDTRICNYFSLSQPAIRPVRAGANLYLVLWHLVLTSTAPAEAHVAITIGGQTAWERRIPIPSSENVYTPTIPMAVAAREGDPIVLHLHNHGANSWRFLELSTDP